MRKNWKGYVAVLSAAAMAFGSVYSMPLAAHAAKTEQEKAISSFSIQADTTNYTARDSYYDMSDTSVNRLSSAHFQIIWGNGDTTGTVTKAFVQGNLENLENIRSFYLNELHMKDPGQSNNTSVYGTRYYKTNIYIANTGLSKLEDDWAYMSVDTQDFGYIVVNPGAMRVDEPSWVLPHEYAHVITYHQGGVVNGEWYEAMANWYRDQFLGSEYYRYGNHVYGPASDFFQPIVLNSDYYFPHLKNYYDCWPLLLYVTENPDNMTGLGVSLMNQVVSDKTTDDTMFSRLERLSGTSVKDILGGYARRMVTMDFKRQSCYLTYLNEVLQESSNYSKIYTTLNQNNGWLTVSSNRAPMQGGYNIIPLNVDLSKKQVTVNFQGTSTQSDADYRVSIVSKTADNKTRYSTMWNGGENTLTLHGDETAVYLVVCATPDTMKVLETYNLDAVGTRYPYKIQVSSSDTTVSQKPSAAPSIQPSAKPTTEPSIVPTVIPSQSVTGEAVPTVSVNTTANSSLVQNYVISAKGEGSINLSKVKIRYYFSQDGEKTQKFWCDNAGISYNQEPWYINCTNDVSASYGIGYVELNFGGNYSLSEENGTVTIGARISNADWSSFADFKELKTEVYYDGQLIQ